MTEKPLPASLCIPIIVLAGIVGWCLIGIGAVAVLHALFQ